MINEDGVRSLGSATISRRRLLGGLAGSAIALGGGSLLSGCTGTSAPAAWRWCLGLEVPHRRLVGIRRCSQARAYGHGRRVQEEVRRHGHHQHGPAQRLPEQHQHLPPGQPGRRVHLVRRLPDAVLRRQGPGRADRRRLGKIGGNFSDALAKASTGDDGKKYFVPNYNYPWGFFYRKSVWEAKGYGCPRPSTSSRRCARR